MDSACSWGISLVRKGSKRRRKAVCFTRFMLRHYHSKWKLIIHISMLLHSKFYGCKWKLKGLRKTSGQREINKIIDKYLTNVVQNFFDLQHKFHAVMRFYNWMVFSYLYYLVIAIKSEPRYSIVHGVYAIVVWVFLSFWLPLSSW